MTNTEQQITEDGQEISLNDVIDFFVTKWKVLLMGAFFGLIMALGVALLLGKYEAEATLVNKSSIDKSGIDKSGIDYLAWKSLKRNLPMLAAQILEATNNGEDFLRVLSNEKWWEKNVVPTYALGKEDAKAIFGMPKEQQDAESSKIKDFVVTTTGSSKEDALKNLSIATSFLRSGAAYLALKDVITNYQIALTNSESEIARSSSELEDEMIYLNKRVANLELIKAKYPGSSVATINQSVDPKDSNAKYLPILAQLIAANNDISMLKEKLSRLNNRKNQLAIMGNYLSQAKPVIDKNFDGLSAAAELMQIESNLRKNLPVSNPNIISVLDNIKFDLTSIQTRFTLGLEQPTFFDARKPHYLKPVAIGLAAGFFLALLFSLWSVVWLHYRQRRL